MGTTDGIDRFKPHILAAAFVAGGGVLAVVPEQTCSYITENVAAFSEPAFSALKGDRIVLEGMLGWHYFYDPETQETDFLQRWMSRRAIYLHDAKFGDLIEADDLEGTSPGMFFMRGPDDRFDGKVVHWHEVRDAGYDIRSTSDALLPCNAPSA